MSQWFVIDQNGRRPVSPKGSDFWARFQYDDQEGWPDFAQLVLDAKLEHIQMAVRTWASTVGLEIRMVTEHVEDWDDAILIARNGNSYCLSERVEIEEMRIHAESAELIAGLLSCNAAYFGAENANGAVFVNTYDLGQIDVAWFDSEAPGPSYARVFHRHGSCTEEDPRAYALHRMDMPATSPLLDRYAFIATMLSPLGLEKVEPTFNLEEVVCAIQLIG